MADIIKQVKVGDTTYNIEPYTSYITLSTQQDNISGRKTFTGGVKISGRYQSSGDDEGLIIGRAANSYAGLCLGDPSGIRSVLYLKPDNTSIWRYNPTGNTNYDIAHPGKAGTIALTSDIDNLIDGAPGALDTLNELSAALGDDKDFAATVTNLITGVDNKVDDEISRAVGVESSLQTQINGKAPTDHGTHVSYGTTTANLAPTASAGTATTVSRSDHVHSDRTFLTLIPTGTQIGANVNLNTTTYIKVGRYYCSANTTVETLLNCPTTKAFMMTVYSPLATTIDNETTNQYVYRVRKLLTYTGDEYVQYVSSGSTAGSFTYGAWKKILNTDNVSGTTNYIPKFTGANTIGSGWQVRNNATSHLEWTAQGTDGGYIPTINKLAYWNGRYNATSSNLKYCNQGIMVATAADSNGNATTCTANSVPRFDSTTGSLIKKSGVTINDSNHVSATKFIGAWGGGNVTDGHVYLTGSNAGSSTGNTTQLVFGTSTTNHVALSANDNALVINPTTSSTTNQIVLYLNQQSQFPNGISCSNGYVDASSARISNGLYVGTSITHQEGKSLLIGNSSNNDYVYFIEDIAGGTDPDDGTSWEISNTGAGSFSSLLLKGQIVTDQIAIGNKSFTYYHTNSIYIPINDSGWSVNTQYSYVHRGPTGTYNVVIPSSSCQVYTSSTSSMGTATYSFAGATTSATSLTGTAQGGGSSYQAAVNIPSKTLSVTLRYGTSYTFKVTYNKSSYVSSIIAYGSYGTETIYATPSASPSDKKGTVAITSSEVIYQGQTNIGAASNTNEISLGASGRTYTYLSSPTGTWSYTSDKRDKTDIELINSSLHFINKLQPVTYVENMRESYINEDGTFNQESHQMGVLKKHRRRAGFLAQDVYELLKKEYGTDNYASVVDYNRYKKEDEGVFDRYSFNGVQLIPFLVKAIQEQQDIIESLEEKINLLEEKIQKEVN